MSLSASPTLAAVPELEGPAKQGSDPVARHLDRELERLKSHADTNRTYLASVRRGEFSNAWVDHILDEQNCPVVRGDVDAGWDEHWPENDLVERVTIEG